MTPSNAPGYWTLNTTASVISKDSSFPHGVSILYCHLYCLHQLKCYTSIQGYYAGRTVTSLAWEILLEYSFRHIIRIYPRVIRAALKMFVSFRDHGAHKRVGWQRCSCNAHSSLWRWFCIGSLEKKEGSECKKQLSLTQQRKAAMQR